VRETLPEGFQRSEFLLEHGAVDMILDRRELRQRVTNLLTLLTRQPLPRIQAAPAAELTEPPATAEA
jgi:acetyl-CoA carboxylase carboxyl transferase subunit beta